ncbi:D-glycero-beta-D-manno-heptose 1-phosphate adenylyltransferase [Prosthecochloris sp. GSB1]|uniref:D-glycero-beta-D-manno-heptose 1-phosphate adenylyltransferase n=1 Tax=Prosthecochloris sp. GSB1 TaxID=281093 RepID=UPI000B8CAC46|nr:D-glycero-beta-D-manno-heptose 1-phosphate adenylyltransferase [Prosthecochloris sp. GSB1]ASQ89822.1 D-glycero-beta-D-manno-heptose 1-phosphate adenylyltransferase [Prosthecochloris sp. GSB1]
MPSKEKLLTSDDAELLVRRLQRKGRKIVFTNGCFDILHAGHVQYLEKARAMGDALVVGVNSDASVRRLKGERRPVSPQADRSLVLAGLESVDAVVLFDEDTPELLIQKLLPDILVKGADWPIEKIAGARAVLESGGKVETVEFLEGRSTTGLIERIVSARCGATPPDEDDRREA